MSRATFDDNRLAPTESERSRAGLATGRVDQAEALARLLPERGGRDVLLPLLHALQDEFGYIDDAIVPAVAEGLNLSRADVHGVVTFYHDFRRSLPGRHRVQFCRAESCQARGGAAAERRLVTALGVAMGETRADGVVTLEAVYCLGLCAIGPAALVDGRPVARLAGAAIDALAAELAA